MLRTPGNQAVLRNFLEADILIPSLVQGHVLQLTTMGHNATEIIDC